MYSVSAIRGTFGNLSKPAEPNPRRAQVQVATVCGGTTAMTQHFLQFSNMDG